MIFAEVKNTPDMDVIYPNLRIVQDGLNKAAQRTMSKATFHRAMKELVDKSFIGPSVDQNMYFLNPNIFFDADCLKFTTEYRKKWGKARLARDSKGLV